MKNKRITYIIYFMIIIIIATFFILVKYYPVTVEKKIMLKKWYNYETTTGYYNTIYFDNQVVTFNKPSNINVRGRYDNCNKYTYDKRKRIFNLNCGEKIVIDNVSDKKLVLIINNKKKVFYDAPEKSLNYEFENYFNKSISEYKMDMQQNIDLITINYERMLEVVAEKENSTFVFIGDNCSSIDCSLFLDVLEKWITTNDRLYYINIEELNDKQIDTLSKKIKDFNKDKEYYNDIYPRVIIYKNNSVIDQYQVNCNGFNCTKYIKY